MDRYDHPKDTPRTPAISLSCEVCRGARLVESLDCLCECHADVRANPWCSECCSQHECPLCKGLGEVFLPS